MTTPKPKPPLQPKPPLHPKPNPAVTKKNLSRVEKESKLKTIVSEDAPPVIKRQFKPKPHLTDRPFARNEELQKLLRNVSGPKYKWENKTQKNGGK